MKEIKNILVAVDFNDAVGDILGYAESIARNFGSKIWVVHVAEPNTEFVGYVTGPQYIRTLKDDEIKEEHRNLLTLCETFIDKEIESEALIIRGMPVESMLEEAKKLKADLLIAGTHKYGFFHNLFSESVSLELFKKANIPLLTLPFEEKKEQGE